MFIHMSIEKIDSMVYIVNIIWICRQETGRDFIKRWSIYFLFAAENMMRFLRQFSPRQGWSQTTLDIPTYSHVRINL